MAVSQAVVDDLGEALKHVSIGAQIPEDSPSPVDPNLPNLLTHIRELPDWAQSHDFLYRVCDESSNTIFEPLGRGLVAGKYENFTDSQLRRLLVDNPLDRSTNGYISAVDTKRHIGNQPPYLPSPWVSTTSRWLWAVWEASRRVVYRKLASGRTARPKAGVVIVIIDAKAITDRSRHRRIFYGLELLPSFYRTEHQYSNDTQEVLIAHTVPKEYILSCVPWSNIQTALPQIFFAGSGRGEIIWPMDATYRDGSAPFMHARKLLVAKAAERREIISVKEAVELAYALLFDVWNSVEEAGQKARDAQDRKRRAEDREREMEPYEHKYFFPSIRWERDDVDISELEDTIVHAKIQINRASLLTTKLAIHLAAWGFKRSIKAHRDISQDVKWLINSRAEKIVRDEPENVFGADWDESDGDYENEWD
jgi:hypothetical protein